VYQTEQAKNSRFWITEALFDLMETKSFREIKVLDIAEKAGVSRKTFYRHFETKGHVLIAFTKERRSLCIKDYIETRGFDPVSFIDFTFNTSYINRNRIQLLIRDSLFHTMNSTFPQEIIVPYFPEMTFLRKRLVVEGMKTILFEWLFSNNNIDKTEAEALALELLVGKEKADCLMYEKKTITRANNAI